MVGRMVECPVRAASAWRSARAGSKSSCAVSPGISRESQRASLVLCIRPPRRGAPDDRSVEVARLGPELRARRTQPVTPLGDSLVPYRDLLVPAVDQPVPLEPRHQLIERRCAALDAMRLQRLAQHAPGLLVLAQQAEHQELHVRDRRKLLRHKVSLYTITLDGEGRALVGAI